MAEGAEVDEGERGARPLDTSRKARPGAGVSAGATALRSWLGSLDVEALSDRERVEVVAELERLKGAASAAQARASDALRRSREVAAPRDAGRSVGSEVALARRESPSLGDRFVGLSRPSCTRCRRRCGR